MHSCDESLFLALNFDGGPCLDRIMTLISGMAIWIPFYLLILWLVCRRYGWYKLLSRVRYSRCSSISYYSD